MNLVERVKAILLRPREEWRVIDGEPADLKTLYTNYLCILALIPALSTFVSSTFIGVEMPKGLVKLSIGGGLLCAIYSYFMVLAIVYIPALVFVIVFIAGCRLVRFRCCSGCKSSGTNSRSCRCRFQARVRARVTIRLQFDVN